MPDKENNLFIYEALELRNEYDKHIDLLENLIGEKKSKRGFLSSDEDEKEPSKEFDVKLIEERLKSLQTKRVKLNQELQLVNLKTKLNYIGNEISLSEALEIKKNLIKDIEVLNSKVTESAYVRIIHKEGRDIVKESKQKFHEVYELYGNLLKKLRYLNQEIHKINHIQAINFKDEK